MEYSFVINAANDVSDNYVNTAIETCKEFLELFPEYKDKFDIKIRYSGKEVSAVSGKSIDFDGTISKEQFEQFYPNGNDEFIALPNGRYLVPGESMAWYEAYAKQVSDGLNYDKISPEQRDWANKYLRNQNPTRYFHVGITNKKLYNNDGLFGYGISSPEIGTVVSTSGFDKETFKRLIMHEFGHVFMAVHNDRSNITETKYGDHCATKGCIARDVIYAKLDEANKPHLFCDQCIESMRAYIGKLLENERTPKNQTKVVDSAQELPPNNVLNNEFKDDWRKLAKNIANIMGWEYEEDEKETNFSVVLKANDGSRTFINASSENDVSLSAKDKDGNEKIPDMKVFTELVKKAQKENKSISFGDIRDPEFKARLLVASMHAKPPVKTIGAPEINDEFLSSVEPKTSQLLKTLQNKEKTQNNKNNNLENNGNNQTNNILPKITSYYKKPDENLNVLAEFLSHSENEYGAGMENLSIAYMNRELAIQGHCSFVDPCYVNGDTDKLRIQLVGQRNQNYLVTAPIQVYGNNNAPDKSYDDLLKNTLNMLHRYEHKFDKVFIPIGCQETGKAGHNIALILENCNGAYRATVLDQLGSSAYIDTKNKISEQLRDVGCNDIEMNQNSLTDRNRMDCATVTALLRNYTLDGTDMRNFKNQFDSNPSVKFKEKAVDDQHKKDQVLITDSCTRLADEMLKNGVIVKAGNRSLTNSKEIVNYYTQQHTNNTPSGNYNRANHYCRTI
ncbi:MAG: hypothetical protein IKC10_07140 [Alphaproteobacteria bacterium]|nr:hypothetical protein [Alphaproteobacteria bacterium]